MTPLLPVVCIHAFGQVIVSRAQKVIELAQHDQIRAEVAAKRFKEATARAEESAKYAKEEAEKLACLEESETKIANPNKAPEDGGDGGGGSGSAWGGRAAACQPNGGPPPLPPNPYTLLGFGSNSAEVHSVGIYW